MHSEEPSLLDHLLTVRQKISPEDGGVSTIIYCGVIKTETDMTEALALHRKMVEDEVNSNDCNISGILIGQGNGIVHLLEGPCYAVLNIMKNLSEHSHFVKGGLQAGRVVYNIEDRPNRCYPEWYSCVIQERRSQVEDVSPESCSEVVHEMASGLFDIGKGLYANQSREVKFSQYSNQIPGKNLIVGLANSELFFDLKGYVETFADSYHVDLESERSWPVEPLALY